MELSPFSVVNLDRHGLQEMLSSRGIQVSNGKEYALSDVIDTIKHAFGGSPQIVCKKGSVPHFHLHNFL